MALRALQSALEASLADRPVVLLVGSRQVGKSTLCQQLRREGRFDSSITFDDLGALSAAKGDPVGFVAGLGGRVILDEIQRVPEILLPLKAEVDRHREPGRFLLTGSANVLTLPRVADSLAGRMDVLQLHAFSQGEVEGQQDAGAGGGKDGFVDQAFSHGASLPQAQLHDGQDLVSRVLRGGFPEIVTTIKADRRAAWWDSYVLALLQRDLRELANVADMVAMPRLLALLAARSASLLNLAELSRAVAIPGTTLKRYLGLLEASFLVAQVPAWHANLGKRLVKANKVHLCDTGLIAHLLGLDEQRLHQQRSLLGPLLESFVAQEVIKQIGWSTTRPKLFHYRSHSGDEVDLVLEDRSGRLVGIEIKATGTLNEADFKGLRGFAQLTGDKFWRGFLLYNGSEVVPLSHNLWAIPLHSLWTWGFQKLHSNPLP